MIVETRYRDISAQEMLKCVSPLAIKKRKDPNYKTGPTEFKAGDTILIETPGVTRADINTQNLSCQGPFYFIANTQRRYVVCPHIAEIGD